VGKITSGDLYVRKTERPGYVKNVIHFKRHTKRLIYTKQTAGNAERKK